MRAALVLVVAGCWSTSTTGVRSSEPPLPAVEYRPQPAMRSVQVQPRVSRCATVIDHALELSRDDLKRIAQPSQLDAIRDTAVESCEAMQWTAEALDCFEVALDTSDIQSCSTHLSAEQNSDLSKRMMDAMKP